MKRIALLALLLPATLQAGEPTFCDSPLRGACFYLEALGVQEVSHGTKADYLHTLTGRWTGSALSGLTDLYWLARFDAYDTSAEGRRVYIHPLQTDSYAEAWHDEFSQPRGLTPGLWDYLSIVIWQGNPLRPGARVVTRCGGGCTRGFYVLEPAPTVALTPPHRQYQCQNRAPGCCWPAVYSDCSQCV